MGSIALGVGITIKFSVILFSSIAFFTATYKLDLQSLELIELGELKQESGKLSTSKIYSFLKAYPDFQVLER